MLVGGDSLMWFSSLWKTHGSTFQPLLISRASSAVQGEGRSASNIILATRGGIQWATILQMDKTMRLKHQEIYCDREVLLMVLEKCPRRKEQSQNDQIVACDMPPSMWVIWTRCSLPSKWWVEWRDQIFCWFLSVSMSQAGWLHPL